MKTPLIPARTSALFVFMSAPFASTVAACQLPHNIYQMARLANFNTDNRDGSAQLVAVIPTRRRALSALRLAIRSKVHFRLFDKLGNISRSPELTLLVVWRLRRGIGCGSPHDDYVLSSVPSSAGHRFSKSPSRWSPPLTGLGFAAALRATIWPVS